MEVREKRIGNIYGFTGGSYDGNVFDKDHISPTLRSCMCHGSVPEIIEIRKVDKMYEENTIPSRAEQSRAEQLNRCLELGRMDNSDGSLEIANRVYSNKGLSPCLNAHANDTVPKVLEVKKMEKQIVAMRGRGINNEQQLEIQKSGCSNTITSATKDNLVMEKKTIKIRQATKDGFVDCEVPGIADLNYTGSKTRRGRVVRGGADKSYSDNGEYP